MAKALLGHVNSDVRTTSVLAVENRRLRRRVDDLEALVLRLQADNDRLAAAAREAELLVDDLQPAGAAPLDIAVRRCGRARRLTCL